MPGVSSRQPVSGMHGVGKIKLKFRPPKKTKYTGLILFLTGVFLLIYLYLFSNVGTRHAVVLPALRFCISGLHQLQIAAFGVVKNDIDLNVNTTVFQGGSHGTMHRVTSLYPKLNVPLAGGAYVEDESMQNLLFAQGYTHAKNRLFQMDVLGRRLATGTISEVIGVQGIVSDKTMRLWDIAGLAAQDLASLQVLHDAEVSARAAGSGSGDMTALEHLDWYTKGVNAYISSHKGTLPVEYALLSVYVHANEVRTWTNADTLALVRYHLMYATGNLKLQDGMMLDALRELLDDEDGVEGAGVKSSSTHQKPFDFLFGGQGETSVGSVAENGARSDSRSTVCSRIDVHCIPIVGSTAWLTGGGAGVQYAADMYEKSVLPSKYLPMELVIPSGKRSESSVVSGLTIPGIPFIWTAGETSDILWSLHTADPMYGSTDAAGSPTPTLSRAMSRPSAGGIRSEAIHIRGKKHPLTMTIVDGDSTKVNVVDDNSDNGGSLFETLYAYMRGTNSILAASDLDAAMEKTYSKGRASATFQPVQFPLVNVPNVIKSLHKLTFATNLNDCTDAYDEGTFHRGQDKVAVLFCVDRVSVSNTRDSTFGNVYDGSVVVPVGSGGSGAGRIVLATDFGFHSNAGTYLAEKLLQYSIASDSDSPAANSCQADQCEAPSSNSATSSLLFDLHSPTAALLAEFALDSSNQESGMCSAAAFDPLPMKEHMLLSITESVLIHDILRADVAAGTSSSAEYTTNSRSAVLTESFRLELYTLLTSQLFGRDRVADNQRINTVLMANQYQYYKGHLLSPLSLGNFSKDALEEDGSRNVIGLMAKKCEEFADFLTDHLLTLRDWIRVNIHREENYKRTNRDDFKLALSDSRLLESSEGLLGSLSSAFTNDYLDGRFHERFGFYSDWYINFALSEHLVRKSAMSGSSSSSVQLTSPASLRSHINGRNFHTDKRKSMISCLALKKAVGSVVTKLALQTIGDGKDSELAKMSDQDADATVSRQYYSAIMSADRAGDNIPSGSVEAETLKENRAILADMHQKLEWGRFHQRRIPSLMQFSRYLREIFTARGSNDDAKGDQKDHLSTCHSTGVAIATTAAGPYCSIAGGMDTVFRSEYNALDNVKYPAASASSYIRWTPGGATDGATTGGARGTGGGKSSSGVKFSKHSSDDLVDYIGGSASTFSTFGNAWQSAYRQVADGVAGVSREVVLDKSTLSH